MCSEFMNKTFAERINSEYAEARATIQNEKNLVYSTKKIAKKTLTPKNVFK